jgi:peptidyl-prolyl cis-trans isomerase C
MIKRPFKFIGLVFLPRSDTVRRFMMNVRGRVLFLTMAILCLGVFIPLPLIHAQGEKILAKVGSIVITQEDLDAAQDKLASSRRGVPYTRKDKEELLNNLIQSAIIRQEAEKEKLDQNPVIKAKVRLFDNELLLNEYLKAKFEPLVRVEKEELDKYLKGHPELYFPYEIRFREIVVQKEEDIKKVMEDLRKGRDFAEVAKERSIARSKIYGGLRVIKDPKEFPRPYLDLIIDTKIGEISDVIQLNKDIIVVKVEERKDLPIQEMTKRPGQPGKDLEKVVEEAIEKLKRQKIEALAAKQIEEMKGKTKVEVYYDQMK